MSYHFCQIQNVQTVITPFHSRIPGAAYALFSAVVRVMVSDLSPAQTVTVATAR